MLIQSYKYLCDLPSDILIKCLAVFNEMALQVCEGQQYDMDFEIQAEVDMESCLKIIELKTAVLLGAAQMGAIIEGSNEEQSDALYEFGRNIGIAFQLKDDLLDVFGDEQTFGKQVGGDIIASKACLYLKALSLSEGKQKMELLNLYSSQSLNDTEKVERVKITYTSMNIKEHIDNLINYYYSEAI